ncbi:hypothetical protein AK830_g12206 [Neonectria ditissima]|uniref:Uncharacterized protein n=1 Tax=Neonectria ditissima TaxID=78410 RepID=A0A0P7B0Y1_9HYPO|nr:hypothetical protein AK830_g12206 [Neonectria ditissima]
MRYTLAFGLALASLAATAPAPQAPDAPDPNDPWKGVIDPWGIYGHKPDMTKRANIEVVRDESAHSGDFRIGDVSISGHELLEHAKRATGPTIADYVGLIPGCDRDPSDSSVPKPGWAVNQGTKIPKEGDDDQCTTGHGGDHCWTEYRLVEAAIEYFSWVKSGPALNCAADAGSSCTISIQSLQQSCSLTGTTETSGFDYKIFEASIGIGLAPDKKTLNGDFGLSTSLTHSWASTEHHLRNNCAGETATVSCTWSNPNGERENLCHQLWYADRVAHIWGQAQRVCNKCTEGNVQQNTGDGNVCVRGQMEFDFRLPLNKLVHCDGKCNSEDPGLNMPPNGERKTYEDVKDWNLIPIRPKRPEEV